MPPNPPSGEPQSICELSSRGWAILNEATQDAGTGACRVAVFDRGSGKRDFPVLSDFHYTIVT